MRRILPVVYVAFDVPASSITLIQSMKHTMKTCTFIAGMTLIVGSLVAADSNPKQEVSAAAKALGDKPNYSWKTTVTVPEGSRFRPGPMEGKTEKDGFTCVTMSFGDNKTEAVIKGEKAAVTDREGEWQSVADLGNEGPGRFLGAMVRNLKTPAVQAAELASETKELKKEGDAYSAELTEEGAKNLLRFGRGATGATTSNAKGSVKFWLKDGALSKYEFKVKGTVSFDGNDREVDRTTLVEIKDVGTTKVDAPAGAKKKLS